jgi:hypothetical protein
VTIVNAAPAPTTRGWRGVALPAATAAGAVAAVAFVGAVDPNQAGHYPTCPFLAATGYWCPGCGSLRAIHALAHLDVATALARNPFTVLTVVGFAVAFVVWVRRRWLGQPRTYVAPAWLLYSLLAGVLAFWVLRNVPGWTWLSPA